jgi:hypothetical protein
LSAITLSSPLQVIPTSMSLGNQNNLDPSVMANLGHQMSQLALNAGGTQVGGRGGEGGGC